MELRLYIESGVSVGLRSGTETDPRIWLTAVASDGIVTHTFPLTDSEAETLARELFALSKP